MKTILKRILCVCISITLSLGMFACGNKEQKKEGQGNETILPISDHLQSVFHTSNIMNETVMFIDYGDAKTLLYTPDKIVSVTSYDGKTTYKEGVDYQLQDGKLVIPEGSAIPCITSQQYYVADSELSIYREDNFMEMPLYWGDKDAMSAWQVCVTYTHSDAWKGYKHESYEDRYADFIKKLEDGQDVTIQFYGDSITVGANSSYYAGIEPGQHPYTILFVQILAEIFDYTVNFVDLQNDVPVPKDDLAFGKRGTITYVNNSILDATGKQGLSDFDTLVKSNLNEYGCDLFVLAFGMEDGEMQASTVAETQQKILEKVLKDAPEAALMLVSTMIPRPNSNFDQFQDTQEQALLSVAEKFNEAGNPCAVACMTSVSQAIYEHKDYEDCTGNNANQPNDFLNRIYAQTLFQTILGYENAATKVVSE